MTEDKSDKTEVVEDETDSGGEGGSSAALKKTASSSADTKESTVEVDKKKKRGKVKKVVTEGTVHIRATFNNTMVTISTLSGDVLCHQSAGGVGFKGSRKGTPFAAQQAIEHAVKVAKDNFQMRKANIEVSGAGGGRDSAIRAVKTSGLEVMSIQEKTRIPHNGCKPSKKAPSIGEKHG